MGLNDDCNRTMFPNVHTVAQGLTLTSCSLSVIGTVTIITTYIIWRDIRSVARGLLVFLSIADFLVAISNAMGTVYQGNITDTFCKTQSAVTTYSNLCSFFWTVIIAVYIFISVVFRKPGVARRLVPLYHVIAWIVPAAIIIAAISENVLGKASSKYTLRWCWIRGDRLSDGDMDMWMLITGKGWEVGAYFVTLVLYLIIKVYVWIDKLSQHRYIPTVPDAAIVQRIDRKMTFVPIVFICLRISGTVRFFLYYASHPCVASHPALIILQGIGDSGQGWANCIMFCFLTERVRGRMRKACLSCLCCQCICDATGEEQQPLNVNGNDGMKSIYSRVDDSAHFEHSLQETGKV